MCELCMQNAVIWKDKKKIMQLFIISSFNIKVQYQKQKSFKILKHIINSFKEQIRKVLFIEILNQKPFNKEFSSKWADYGSQKLIKVDTPIYMSSESYLENKQSEMSDIWSVGVDHYQMLQVQCPWVINLETEFKSLYHNYNLNVICQYQRNLKISQGDADKLIKIQDCLQSKMINIHFSYIKILLRLIK